MQQLAGLSEVWDFKNPAGVKAWDYGKIMPEDMEKALAQIVSMPNVTDKDLQGIKDRALELYKDSILTRDELNFYTKTSLSDFKEMFLENTIKEGNIPDNITKFATRKGVMPIVKQISDILGKMNKRIVGGTAIGKNYDTLILDVTHQGGEIRVDCNTDEVTVHDVMVDLDDLNAFKSALDKPNQRTTRKPTDNPNIDSIGENIDEVFTHQDYMKVLQALDKVKNTNRKVYDAIVDMLTDLHPHDYSEVEAQLATA